METAVAATRKTCDAAVAEEARKGKADIAALTASNQALEDEIADLRLRTSRMEGDVAAVTEEAKDSRLTFRSSRKEKETEMATLQAAAGPAATGTPQKPKDEFNRMLSEMENLVAGEIK